MADELTIPDDTSGYLQGEHLAAFMAQDMRGKCGSCKWFDLDDPNGPSWSDVIEGEKFAPQMNVLLRGWCHRFPPTPSIRDDLETDLPFVNWNDWCGEYTERPSKVGDVIHLGKIALPVVETGTPLKKLKLGARALKVCIRLIRDKIRLQAISHPIATEEYTAEELCRFCDNDFLERKQCGMVTLKEIKDKLKTIGLELKRDQYSP